MASASSRVARRELVHFEESEPLPVSTGAPELGRSSVFTRFEPILSLKA